ncbi:hypothetical protein D3C81_1867450 [compost metagenome]
MTHNYTVKPADTAGASGYSTVFMTGLTDVITDCIVQLCRERAIADTGCVSFGNADNLLDLRRTHTGTDAYTAG